MPESVPLKRPAKLQGGKKIEKRNYKRTKLKLL